MIYTNKNIRIVAVVLSIINFIFAVQGYQNPMTQINNTQTGNGIVDVRTDRDLMNGLQGSNGNGVVIVTSSSCNPCIIYLKTINQLRAENKTFPSRVFLYIHGTPGSDMSIPSKYEVSAVPTTLVIKNYQIAARHTGPQGYNEITNACIHAISP
ncbi:hypothetical protein NEOKW01_0291 [Nematocida sp. AWRm80]|nr:hypothetical protein NEOKW01_0291 [Nematocida sp. AWRm80]